MNMKYKMKILLVCCMLLVSLSIVKSVYAVGEGNIDAGGSGMGSGTTDNYWSPGNDGVRVSIVRVVDKYVVSIPIDYTNKIIQKSLISFDKKSKIDYQNGGFLIQHVGGYSYRNVKKELPKIISSNGSTNIKAIKQYFCSEYAVMMIANDTGLSYEELISGKYKLLLEPIAYFTFQGAKFGMTATEAALYDQQLSGGLRRKMVSLSHKNLPLAMFLEKPDLGYESWNGSTNSAATNNQIISCLGLGIIKFNEKEEVLSVGLYDYEYRVETDVITAVDLYAKGRITPDNPATVVFKVEGRSYKVTNIVIPEGESQIVWCKWRTPKTPQNIVISVSNQGGTLDKSLIRVNVIDMSSNDPPNPKATDRNESFTVPELPKKEQKENAKWGVWNAWWKADWRWVKVMKWCSHRTWVSDGKGKGHYKSWGHWVDNGYWKDFGDWVYEYTKYYATLKATNNITPDSNVPISSGKSTKSGYGININVSTNLTSNAPESHLTGSQNAVTYFPEYEYRSYWRLLDILSDGYNSVFNFKPNIYSSYNHRVHFTPVWVRP